MLEMLHQALNQVKTQLFCCKSLRIKKKIGVVSKYLYILLYPDKHLFGEQLRWSTILDSSVKYNFTLDEHWLKQLSGSNCF